MATENDYFFVWMVYVAATVGLLVVIWRLALWFSSVELRRVILLTAMTILWTPVRLEPGLSHWVPAFMAAIMESITTGIDAAVARILPIVFVLVVLLCLSLFWHFYLANVFRSYQKPKKGF